MAGFQSIAMVILSASGSKTHNQGDVSQLLLRWGRYAMGITSALAYRRQVVEQVLPIPTHEK